MSNGRRFRRRGRVVRDAARAIREGRTGSLGTMKVEEIVDLLGELQQSGFLTANPDILPQDHMPVDDDESLRGWVQCLPCSDRLSCNQCGGPVRVCHYHCGCIDANGDPGVEDSTIWCEECQEETHPGQLGVWSAGWADRPDKLFEWKTPLVFLAVVP